MTNGNAVLSVDTFLRTFFGGDNRLTLDRIESGTDERGTRVKPWVDRLRRDHPAATILPRVRADNTVVWYGLASSPAELRSLADDVLAFVGPTWSTFRGHRGAVQSGDVIDESVLQFTGGSVFTFVTPSVPGAARGALDALDRMRAVWALMPERISEVPRTTGRVLRDFYLALHTGEREGAESQLRYLRDHNRLDAVNLLFLRVQLLATLARWEELSTLPELPSVVQMRRPVAVTEALIRAVYYGCVAKFEGDDDPGGAIEAFRKHVLPAFGDLFVTQGGMRAAEVAKSFMLAAIVADPPRREACRALLAREDLPSPDQAWLTRLATFVPGITASSAAAPSGDVLATAITAMMELDFEQALELATTAPPSRARVKVLFECAYNVQTLSAERAALRALDELESVERQAFLAVRTNASYFEYLTSRSATTPPPVAERAAPGDWFEWADRLREDPDWPRASHVAEQGAVEWTVESITDHPNGSEELINAIHELQDLQALHDSLPHLLAFFQRDPSWPRDALADLYRGLLEFIVYVSKGGGSTLGHVRDLTDGLLRIRGNEADYGALIQHCTDIWSEYASPAYLQWVLDLLDLFIAYPCPSPGTRARLLMAVIERIPQFYRRVDAEQWRFLVMLCEDYGYPEALTGFAREEPTPELGDSNDPLTKLRGKLIAIYTLTEDAGKRAKYLLERRCEDVTVRLSSAHVGNDRLRDMARNADVFVMATASATHAATNFVEAHRPRNRPLLRPTGKGSASILRALCDFVEATG